MIRNFEIKRSNRKTMAIEITWDLRILIRAPYWVSDEEINDFANKNADWIDRHFAIAQEKIKVQNKSPSLPPFTNAEIRSLSQEMVKLLPPRIEYYAKLLGVSYGKVTIRNQVSRWGSCTAKGNLNFNCLLALCPPSVLDYVVIHELCHRKEMNHSKMFWALVEELCPDYKKHREWLGKEGVKLIARMRQ